MSYNPIINKLKDLRQIQPDSEWSRATRVELLERMNSVQESPKVGFFAFSYPLFKPVLVTLLILAMLFGGGVTVQVARTALPGNFLYPVKRATEIARLYLTTTSDRAAFRTELVLKRLKEIESLGQEDNKGRLAQARQNFHQELINLQKEIVARASDIGSLPVLDERQVIEFGQAGDLADLLEETRICLGEGDFKAALAKTLEVEELIKAPNEANQEENSSDVSGSLSRPFKPEIINPDFSTDLIKE